MADVEFTIERTGYLPIALNSDGGGSYGLQSGTTGFGVPTVVSQFTRGAGSGGQYRGERVDMRTMDIEILILGDNRLTTGELVRKLANLVRARRNQPLPRLVATYATGEVYEVPFVYQSGLEIEYAESMSKSTRVFLSVVCPDPFWTARDALSFTIQNNSSSVGLLPEFAKLQVMASTAIGSVPVNNPGDVDSDISWRITGPGGPTTIQVNGEGFVYNTTLIAGDIITVDGKTKTVANAAGVNQYAGLAAAPKFPTLQPGSNTVLVSMVGATVGVSSVTGFYKPRREVIF